jgi:hypothetical protein
VDRYGYCIGASHGYLDSTFEEINATYFAGRLQAEIPEPDSEEFFREYSEPVEDWIDEAVRLAKAIREPQRQDLTELLRVSSTDYIVGPMIARADFTVGSLLEAAAFQFLEDHNGGFELRYCQNQSCPQRLYYDNDPRSRFCSQRCASTQRQRDHREDKRNKQKRRHDAAIKGRRKK